MGFSSCRSCCCCCWPSICFILGLLFFRLPLLLGLFCDTRIWYAVCVLRPDRTCRKRTCQDTQEPGPQLSYARCTRTSPIAHRHRAPPGPANWHCPLWGPNIESNVYVSASGLSPCPSHSARTFVFHFKFLSYSPGPLCQSALLLALLSAPLSLR